MKEFTFSFDDLFESLEFSNPHTLFLSTQFEIIKCGIGFVKSIPNIKTFTKFDEVFSWKSHNPYEKLSSGKPHLLVMQSLDGSLNYKVSGIIKEWGIILHASPIINAQFDISNYKLTLFDFPQHDYIAEYIFLREASTKALIDSNNLISGITQKNKALNASQQELSETALFPNENPNPVLRLDSSYKLIYHNEAAHQFLIDFGIGDEMIIDNELKLNLTYVKDYKIENHSLFRNRNERTYVVNIRSAVDKGFFNIYATDISHYVNQVSEKENELLDLNKKLKLQQEFYEYIFNNIPADIAVFDELHRYVFINPQGIKNDKMRELMIGKDDFDYCKIRGLPEAIAIDRRNKFNQVTNSNVELEWEQFSIDANGNKTCVLRRLRPTLTTFNGIKYVIGYGVNITKLKNVEENLRANQALLQRSESMGQIGSWEIKLINLNNWNENISIWSDQTFRIFGYEPENVAASYQLFMDHVHPEDKHLITDSLSTLFIPGISREVKFRIILKDGTMKHLLGKFSVQFSDNNIPEKLIGMAQDITHTKMLEEELENHNQNLQIEIENQTKELISANKNLDAFNYSISHDLRTPIRVLEIYVDLLKESVKDEESASYIENLTKGIDEIKGMISALLEFSKYGKSTPNIEPINMEEKINNTIANCSKNIVKEVEFRVIKTPSISADPKLITHVLDNLISNAIKYTSKKHAPLIEISGEKDEHYTTYYVKDNGDGFDQHLAHQLFKPFSRLHNEEEFEGSGAGLAIVERIISRHNGTIWAESIKGKGATFYFKLPND